MRLTKKGLLHPLFANSGNLFCRFHILVETPTFIYLFKFFHKLHLYWVPPPSQKLCFREPFEIIPFKVFALWGPLNYAADKKRAFTPFIC